MKRSIALLLVVCMICTFAACGPADEKEEYRIRWGHRQGC